ncbi:MAG: GNAT family N-acetyltransferase [Alphaproteobacteria bacterium]|nr:GNAT family N-acetyltransferase [Alphaproteobacteria bacterium]
MDGQDSGDQNIVSVNIVEKLSQLSAVDWDACAGSDNPFVSYAFLSALEDSGSATSETGWQPHHLAIGVEGGRLLGVVPMYLKSHSQGEYVFDWGWADAYERAGGRYYPKLQAAAPFSPVTGPRILARPGDDADAIRATLIAGMIDTVKQYNLSSVNVTFAHEADAGRLEAAGFLIRHGHQFHWQNQGYDTFDDFLANLSSRKRKNIRKERKAIADAGVRFDTLVGDDIKPHHWDEFHEFYVSTYDRKWGYPYLTREFFDILNDRMADKVALIRAEEDGYAIGGALNLIGSEALFGRNWGCNSQRKFLHFEACYYRAIDLAIELRLARVEAGTQGPHKIQRGYLPVQTYSAHWIRDEGFRDAVADFLVREKQAEAGEVEYLGELSPFRRSEND